MGLAIPWALPLGRPHCRGLTDLPCLRSPWPAGPPLVKEIGDDHQIRIFETTNRKNLSAEQSWERSVSVWWRKKSSISSVDSWLMRWVYNSCVFRYEDFGISAEHKGPDNTYATTDVYICHFFSTTEANVTQSHALCGVLGPAWSFCTYLSQAFRHMTRLVELFLRFSFPFHPLKKQWGWLLVVSFH